MKIAIIGSGISGLYAAWQLSKQHEIHIFEKNQYFGGHTDTHHLMIDGQQVAVDSGFIVFNQHNYPLFTEMLQQLGVGSEQSDMSFSVNNQVTGLQYNPSQKWSLFAKPQNFLNANFRQMLRDLLRFYRRNQGINVQACESDLTIEQYLDQHGYSKAFREEHLYPMCGALWSSPIDQVAQIPYKFVVSFFQHHRMLQLKQRPVWQTVQGGSSQYIQAIRQQCSQIYWHQQGVISVERNENEVTVETTIERQTFDWVIFATHADDTLQLLAQPSEIEKQVLSQFSYQDNTMVVHHDSSIMPKRRALWASWHVHVTATSPINSTPHYSFSYWMNCLQNLPCKTQIFASLNPNFKIDPSKVLVKRHYRHPVFDAKAIEAQQNWAQINGQQRSSFCGAYWGWGFHEDGARSAARVVKHLLD